MKKKYKKYNSRDKADRREKIKKNRLGKNPLYIHKIKNLFYLCCNIRHKKKCFNITYNATDKKYTRIKKNYLESKNRHKLYKEEKKLE